MTSLPADTLALYDTRNAPIGVARFAPRKRDPSKGECIFDMEPLDNGAGDEVRWLFKRGYKRAGEHKFKVKNATLTISPADFRVVFDIAEDGELQTRPPAPVVTALFETD